MILTKRQLIPVEPNVVRTVSDISRLAAEALDSLQVTDTVYEDLWFTSPLVEAVAETLASSRLPGNSILVVGGNSLLVAALRALGFRVEIWAFGDQLVATDVQSEPFERVNPAGPWPIRAVQYDAIVVTLSLEFFEASPTETLGRLRSLTRPGGTVVVATEQAGRLGRRVRALRGRSPVPYQRDAAGSTVSWNWPSGRRYWTLDKDEWLGEAAAAGFDVLSTRAEVGQRATPRAMPMGIIALLKSQARNAFKKRMPSLRDYLILQLRNPSPREQRSGPKCAGPTFGNQDRVEWPQVSVIVENEQSANLSKLTSAIKAQTYPLDRIEVLLCGGTAENGPEFADRLLYLKPLGTFSRSRAVSMSSGEVVVFLSASSHPSPFWIEAAVMAMRAGAEVVVGAIALEPSRSSSFLSGDAARFVDTGRYPSRNVFYRRDVLLEIPKLPEGAEPDTMLVWNLRHLGKKTIFRPEVLTYEASSARLRDWVSRRAAEHSTPEIVAQSPGLSRYLPAGLFASPASAAYWTMMLGVGLGVSTGHRFFMMLAAPWMGMHLPHVTRGLWPPNRWPLAVPRLAVLTLGGAIETTARLVGSMKTRRAVL